MNNLSSGVDIIEIDRFQEAIDRHGERFLRRVFTQFELIEVGSNTASLAARFAAKEAVSKALGCGIGLVGWREIEIRRDPNRQPQLYLYGAAAQIADQLGVIHWSISLSHSRNIAIAVAVAAIG